MEIFGIHEQKDLTAELITFFSACLAIYPYCSFVMGLTTEYGASTKIEISAYAMFNNFYAERELIFHNENGKSLEEVLADLEQYLTANYDRCRIHRNRHIISYNFEKKREKDFES